MFPFCLYLPQAKYSNEAGDSTSRKKTFLRKGEGISRFNSVPKKPVKKPGASRKTFQKTQKMEAETGKTKPGLTSGPSTSEGEGLKKFSVGSRLKTMTGDKKANSVSFTAVKYISYLLMNRHYS